MPGPAPDPNARRRNPRPQLVLLPVGGREGPVPEWPLHDGSDAERAVWEELWCLPQAVVWERDNAFRVVARYVRQLVQAEHRDATAASASEVRQMEDRLGLSPMAMKRLGWQIVGELVETPAEVTHLADFRDRLG